MRFNAVLCSRCVLMLATLLLVCSLFESGVVVRADSPLVLDFSDFNHAVANQVITCLNFSYDSQRISFEDTLTYNATDAADSYFNMRFLTNRTLGKGFTISIHTPTAGPYIVVGSVDNSTGTPSYGVIWAYTHYTGWNNDSIVTITGGLASMVVNGTTVMSDYDMGGCVDYVYSFGLSDASTAKVASAGSFAIYYRVDFSYVVTDWMPVIVEFAMLSVALGMLGKVARR